MSNNAIPAAEYECGSIKIDFLGDAGNLELVVWDRQVQPHGQPIGREIFRQANFQSINDALDVAAKYIALDTGNDAEQVRRDIRAYQATRPHLEH